MSDEPRDDDASGPTDERTDGDETSGENDDARSDEASAGAGEPQGPPDPRQFGIDPEEMMRDPFGSAFKLLQNPEAMKAIEGFMQSGAGKQMIAQGMNNPMIRQMMERDPRLKQMMQSGGMGGLDPSTLFGGAPTPQADVTDVTPAPEAADESVDEAPLDEPVLDLLESRQAGPAYPDPAPVGSFDTLLADLPEEAREAVIDVAEQRARHHLRSGGMATLESLAESRGLDRPVDVLVGQGAFMGEVAWYAIVNLEDDFESDTFVSLARYALSLVTAPCGYRVPSFVTQLLGFLVDLDMARPEDVRHAIWALSGQPQDGTDGVFEMTWEDVDELVYGLAEGGTEGDPIEDRLFCALIGALLGWQVLDQHGRAAPFDRLVDNLPDARRGEALTSLAELIGGETELEAVRANHLRDALRREMAERLMHEVGATAVLKVAVDTWRAERPWSAWEGALHALDVMWHDADEAPRTAFMERVLKASDTSLRRTAYQVGAAWDPHTWLERAAEDESSSIRSWAEEELKTLR